MEGAGGSHSARVTEWLIKLGRDPVELRGFEVIGRGLSGAHVYRLCLGDEELILKVTGAQREPQVVERADRELRFYEELSPSIPLHLPALLSRRADVSGTALLLAAGEPAPDLSDWDAKWYLQVAEDLARLHAAFWGATEKLRAFHWLRRPPGSTRQTEVDHAWSHWRDLSEQERFRAVLPPDEMLWIQSLLTRIGEIDRRVASLPLTLCHGDCNNGNLLQGRHGGWVWADWQEVGIGRGPEDLSFFCQRAAHDVGLIPRGEIIGVYHRTLEAETGRCIPIDAIRRVMDAADIRTRILHWPAYLGDAPAERVADMVRTMRELAAGLEASSRNPAGWPKGSRRSH